MKGNFISVEISCDDGFTTSLFTLKTSTCTDLFNEVSVQRKSSSSLIEGLTIEDINISIEINSSPVTITKNFAIEDILELVKFKTNSNQPLSSLKLFLKGFSSIKKNEQDSKQNQELFSLVKKIYSLSHHIQVMDSSCSIGSLIDILDDFKSNVLSCYDHVLLNEFVSTKDKEVVLKSKGK